MMTNRFWSACYVVAALCLASLAGLTFADDAPDVETDDAPRKTVERFLLVLERNPRKGTALDRVIEFHTDRGTLDELARQQRKKAEAIGDAQAAEAGRAWMVVGLIENSRGETEAAVEPLERAEQLLPTNAMASFVLGQSLLTLNQLPQAAEAFERAIQRKPAPVDLLEIFQSLGRVRQRLAEGNQVVEVWTRLEKLVPNDSRVPELIALTLLEDGHIEAALPRFDTLAKVAKDPAKRSQFELEAIDIRLRLGQTEQALVDSERMLAGLKPEHWLFREIRRRIEQAFVANGDEAGLIKHFEARLEKRPDDVDAVVRLSRALAGQSRSAEARSRLEAALKQAPSSSVLRLELIELLEQNQKFAEAVAQYEQLDKIEPNHPDHIRDWGFAVLKVRGQESGVRSQEDKHQSAGVAAIWRKLVDAKPKDAVVAAQVAELMRQADLFDDAAELLRRAIELAPEALHHREALGEVLHSQQKYDEALAAWRSMAEGPRRSAENLGQLADVLGRKGFRDESLKTINDACELDRESLELRFKQADLRRMWKQFDSAREAMQLAAELADSPETFDRVVQREIDVLSEAELLTTVIEELREERARDGERGRRGEGEKPQSPRRPLAPSPPRPIFQTPAAQWFRLARYLEAGARLREATAAAHKAVELAPRISLFLQAAARMLAADNQWQGAIDVYERLIAADRKFQIDSLRAIAELESKLGRRDRALNAARDLLSAAPGNPDHAEFVADLCLRFNLQPEALQILRRSSRQNPADKRLALKLTEQLLAAPEAHFKSQISNLKSPITPIDEAREALWRVFEKSSRLDDRLEVIRKLSELAVIPSDFDKLTQRLIRLRQEPKWSRDATLCLVQVHEQAGDTGQARRELKRLLPQSPRDPDLLKRLTSLSEATGDLEAAIAHQRRLLDVTRSREADEHLVVLLRRAGRDAEADTLATRWLESERDPAKVLREIDRLIGNAVPNKNQSVHQALKLTQAWLDRDPQNWEFLFRQASALHELNRSEEKSWAVLDEIMALPISDDTLSILAASRTPGTTHAERTTQRIQQIRSRTNVAKNAGLDYGSARIACLFARLVRKVEPTIPPAVGLDPKATALRTAWDKVYHSFLQGSGIDRLRVRLELLALVHDDPGAQWLTLSALYGVRAESSVRPLAAWREIDESNPLDADTLDRLVAAFRSLRSCDEAMAWDGTPIIEMLCRELIRAGRKDAVQELLAEMEGTSDSPEAFGWLLQQAAINDDTEAALRILSKFASLDFGRTKFATTARGTTRRSDPANVAWWLSHLMIRHRKKLSDGLELSAENLRILDAAFAAYSQPNFGRSTTTAKIAIPATLPHAGGFEKQLRLIQKFVPYDLGLVWQTTTLTGYLEESFPSAEAMPELSVIHVLRQAWSQAGTPRERIKLFKHVKAAADRAEIDSRQRFLWEVALTSLEWWNHWTPNGKLREPSPQRDSLTMMRELFEFDEASPALKLGIVLCHLKYEQRDLALDLLDRITTTDGQQLKEIEQRAVQLAGKLGRAERMRVAAERLFGMRLEPQEELQLAATLSGLGLHEQAEAIRQRAPQRFGNDVGSLLALLEQRLKENKPNEAAQVAEQILLRTHPAGLAASAGRATGAGTQPSSQFLPVAQQARKKALETLASAGRLGPFIEQAEKQFDRSPQSLKLFGQLAELYGAEVSPHGGTTNGGANEKIARLLDRLADSDAPDPQFRLTLARALVSAGKAQLAGPHFLFAIERLPNATAQVLFEAEQTLSELGHVDELATIVLKSKLALNDEKRVQLFRRIVQRLEGPPIRAKLIIQLFEKALRESPEYRYTLAEQLLLVGDSVWQQEELWPMARDLAVPPQNLPKAWTDIWPFLGIDSVRQTNDSRIDLLTWRVVELAHQLKKLDELERHIESAAKGHPNWKLASEVTIGLIRLKQGRLDEARPRLLMLLDWFDDVPIPIRPKNIDMHEPYLLKCGLGDVLTGDGDFDSAVKFYEQSGTGLALDRCRRFAKEPVMQQLAVQIAKNLLCGLDDPKAGNDYNDERDNRVNLIWRAGGPNFVDVAKITAEINQPYIAARLTQAMITRWQLPNANNSDGGLWLRQLDDRFANARAAIKPQMLPTIAAQAARDPNAGSRHFGTWPATHVPFDLLPHVTGDSLVNLRLDSPFVSLLQSAAKDEELWGKWVESLRRTGTPSRPADGATDLNDTNDGSGKSAQPPDLSLPILTALTELFALESNTRRGAVEQLLTLAQAQRKVDRPRTRSDRPRTLPPGFHSQLGLWLVARDCLQRDDLKSLGEQLAELASESASHYFDPRFRWAILRERGELAVKSGDMELATNLWTQLADSALRPRSTEGAMATLVGNQMMWSSQWPLTRLQRTRDLCRLSLNSEMPDVSLAIFRDALDWPREMKLTYPIY